jgi:hypothetical protein
VKPHPAPPSQKEPYADRLDTRPSVPIGDLPCRSRSMEEQLAVNRYCDLRTLGDDKLKNSNALDDLHSAL